MCRCQAEWWRSEWWFSGGRHTDDRQDRGAEEGDGFFLTSAVKHLLRIWLKKTLYYIVHLLVGIGVSPYL